jgi:hypothetical protein
MVTGRKNSDLKTLIFQVILMKNGRNKYLKTYTQKMPV